MSARVMHEAGRVLADTTAYADERRLHEALSQLRVHAPVCWVEVEGYRPFWAIAKHTDVMDIERANDLWINEPRPLLVKTDIEDVAAANRAAGGGTRVLIAMDDPEHRKMRAIGADWFRPKAMRELKIRVDELAKSYVDRMVQLGTECDFAQEVAVNYPLYVILSLLGLPESDFPRMLKLTQEMFGAEDSEFQRGQTAEERLAVVADFFAYFSNLTDSRRQNPTADLASAIANAKIDGEPLGAIETMSYYLIIATAGHDTTSAAISGGLLALLEHPDELQRLTRNMDLMGTAVEEIIRWVVPVKEFMRTATQDTIVRGVPIAAGESVLLSYVSANRDDEVFEEPFRFDVARDPNKQLSFGYGVHFCLGAALARMEIRSFFTELIPRIKSIQLAGEPEFIATTFVGGLKHLPIRYSLK